MAFATTAGGHNGNVGTATTIAIALTGTVGAGDLIVVAVQHGGNFTTTCADSLGNTYTQVDAFFDATDSQAWTWFYSIATTGGATPTVTATFSSTCTFRGIAVQAFSGGASAAILDQHAVSANPTTAGAPADNVVSPSITPSVANCLAVGLAGVMSSANPLSAGTGFTAAQFDATVVTGIDFLVQGAAAAVTAKFTGTLNDRYLCSVAAFLPASSSNQAASGSTPNAAAILAAVVH